MLHEEDLGAVMRRFLDEFGEDPDFLRRGFDVDEPELQQLVLDVLHHAFGRRQAHAEFRLRRLAPVPFVHGVALIDGAPATVLWFEDVGVGLLTVVSDWRIGLNEHVRFHAIQVPGDHPGDRTGAAGGGGAR